MALHYRTSGLVIKKRDSGEADRIFTIYTKDFGKIKVLGKAIRKINSKLKGGIEIISLSEIEFIQGKSYKTLTDADASERFKNIKKDLKTLKIAYRIAQVINRLVRGEEMDEELWKLIRDTFQKLDNHSLPPDLLYYYFLWNFFSILGYKPELFSCAICQKKLNPYNLYFSSSEGGMVCNLCFKKAEKPQKINSDLVKVLRLILKKDWQTIIRLKIQPFSRRLLREISEDYCSYLLSIHHFEGGFKKED